MTQIVLWTPNGLEENIAAPKTIERLEKISYDNNEKT